MSFRLRYLALAGGVGLTMSMISLTAASHASALSVASASPSFVAAPAAVAAAVAAAGSQNVRSAVAVLDTTTGQTWQAGDADGEFPAESVVKVLIAARLLADGQMTGETEQLAFDMITQSDDDAADTLWGLVGGPDVLSWAEQRYGIRDLGAAPIDASRWGNLKLTAAGLVKFYAAVKADQAVGPWLMSAMAQMTPDGSDGTDQTFGLPSAAASGAFKQGWGGDDDNFDSEGLNSTGYVDDGRYAVAIFTQHIPWVSMSALVPVIDSVAAAVAPGGVVTVPQPVVVATPVPTTSQPSGTTSQPSGRAMTSGEAGPQADGRGETGATAGAARHLRVINTAETGGVAAVAVAGLAVVALGGRLCRRRENRRLGARSDAAR